MDIGQLGLFGEGYHDIKLRWKCVFFLISTGIDLSTEQPAHIIVIHYHTCNLTLLRLLVQDHCVLFCRATRLTSPKSKCETVFLHCKRQYLTDRLHHVVTSQ